MGAHVDVWHAHGSKRWLRWSVLMPGIGSKGKAWTSQKEVAMRCQVAIAAAHQPFIVAPVCIATFAA